MTTGCLNGAPWVVEGLAKSVDGATGCGPGRLLARAVAVECEGRETGGGLADATVALGIALLGTVAAVVGTRAAVAGLEDLEGLLESRHGGG